MPLGAKQMHTVSPQAFPNYIRTLSSFGKKRFSPTGRSVAASLKHIRGMFLPQLKKKEKKREKVARSHSVVQEEGVKKKEKKKEEDLTSFTGILVVDHV